MGFKIQQRRKEEPAWKRRIETKISKLRRDLSQIESWRSGKMKNECVQRRLETKYWTNVKGLAAVAEELKQRITAQAEKLKRYQNRIDQFRQNREFQTNHKRLYSRFQGETQSDSPSAEESVTFWTQLWEIQ